jgi:hypothetical protein
MSAWSAGQQRYLAAMGVPLWERREPRSEVPEGVAAFANPTAAVGKEFRRLVADIERAAGGRNLAQLLLDLPRIRASAAAKRALWPTLRALRKG